MHFAISAVLVGMLLAVSGAARAEGPYVDVPAGGFWMGQDGNDPSSYTDEVGIHWAETHAFQIAKYETSNAEFAGFLNAVGRIADASGNPYLDVDDPHTRIHLVGDVWTADAGWETHPVREVSWYGADAYCRWLGGRLPTEEEWEKAARWDEATQHSRMWPWTDNCNCESPSDPGCGNLSLWWCNQPYNGGPTTFPVDAFPGGASPYGAYNMAGNVWEWTMGGYASYPGGPHTFMDYSRDSQRGGSWTNSSYNVRCAARSPQPPYITDGNLGFRVAKSGWEPELHPPRAIERATYNEWVEEFNVATPMDEIRDWWGQGRSFTIEPANSWLVAALLSRPDPNDRYVAGEYMGMIRRDTGGLFQPGDLVDITVRLKYERGDRDYARTSVAVAWGDTRGIDPGGRGADENFGYPWFLIANNSDNPNEWNVVTAKRIVWGTGKFCIGFGLWGNLSFNADPPIYDQHRMYVDYVRVKHSEPDTPIYPATLQLR